MKALKEDSPSAQKLQEVEDLMRKHDISIDVVGHIMFISIGKNEYRLKDLDNNSYSTAFPRTIESERLIIE